MKNLVTLSVGSILALAAVEASAHHSRANFDLDTVNTYEGTVTKVAWNNPHTAFFIETKGPDGKPLEVRFEGNSIATMTRRGWNKETLKVGDKVVFKGNPDRNPNHHFVYMVSATRGDGSAIGGGFRQVAAATTGSSDFTGVWRPAMRMGGAAPAARPAGTAGAAAAPAANANRSVLLGSPTPRNYAVTPKGAASYAKFNGDEDPRNNCVPESLPEAISTAPYEFQIIKRPDGDYEVINENYAARRVIHMNQKAPPAGTKRDYDGYSVGRMEGKELVVETTLFSPQPWGNDAGLDSSDKKHMLERYSLDDEGKTLSVTYTQTDPEYLAKPVVETIRWSLTGEQKIASEWQQCDPAAGNRHLTEAKK